MPGRLGIVRDVDRRRAWQRSAPQRCFVCGRAPAGYGYWLECCHIAGAAHRSDEECNLFLGHHACHASASHGRREVIGGVLTPEYTLADILRGKRRWDPANWDPARLRLLLDGRRLSDEVEQILQGAP